MYNLDWRGSDNQTDYLKCLLSGSWWVWELFLASSTPTVLAAATTPSWPGEPSPTSGWSTSWWLNQDLKRCIFLQVGLNQFLNFVKRKDYRSLENWQWQKRREKWLFTKHYLKYKTNWWLPAKSKDRFGLKMKTSTKTWIAKFSADKITIFDFFQARKWISLTPLKTTVLEILRLW